MTLKGNDLINDNKVLFEAIDKVLQESAKKRLVEDELMNMAGIATKRQLYGETLVRFDQIVEDVLQGKISLQDETLAEGLFGLFGKKKPAVGSKEHTQMIAKRDAANYEKQRAKENKMHARLNKSDAATAKRMQGRI